MNEDFIRTLRDNTEFQVSDEIAVKYEQSAPEYAVLENKYHISEIALSEMKRSIFLKL